MAWFREGRRRGRLEVVHVEVVLVFVVLQLVDVRLELLHVVLFQRLEGRALRLDLRLGLAWHLAEDHLSRLSGAEWILVDGRIFDVVLDVRYRLDHVTLELVNSLPKEALGNVDGDVADIIEVQRQLLESEGLAVLLERTRRSHVLECANHDLDLLGV